MKVSFKVRKGASVYMSVIAGVAFVAMAVARFDLPLEKVLQFLGFTVVLLLAMILIAAPVALLIRWLSNRRE